MQNQFIVTQRCWSKIVVVLFQVSHNRPWSLPHRVQQEAKFPGWQGLLHSRDVCEVGDFLCPSSLASTRWDIEMQAPNSQHQHKHSAHSWCSPVEWNFTAREDFRLSDHLRQVEGDLEVNMLKTQTSLFHTFSYVSHVMRCQLARNFTAWDVDRLLIEGRAQFGGSRLVISWRNNQSLQDHLAWGLVLDWWFTRKTVSKHIIHAFFEDKASVGNITWSGKSSLMLLQVVFG